MASGVVQDPTSCASCVRPFLYCGCWLSLPVERMPDRHDPHAREKRVQICPHCLGSQLETWAPRSFISDEHALQCGWRREEGCWSIPLPRTLFFYLSRPLSLPCQQAIVIAWLREAVHFGEFLRRQLLQMHRSMRCCVPARCYSFTRTAHAAAVVWLVTTRFPTTALLCRLPNLAHPAQCSVSGYRIALQVLPFCPRSTSDRITVGSTVV